jgi:N-acetylmuramoyl-L-alanine amidase
MGGVPAVPPGGQTSGKAAIAGEKVPVGPSPVAAGPGSAALGNPQLPPLTPRPRPTGPGPTAPEDLPKQRVDPQLAARARGILSSWDASGLAPSPPVPERAPARTPQPTLATSYLFPDSTKEADAVATGMPQGSRVAELASIVKANTAAGRPALTGVRIFLDPGHGAGPDWAQFLAKFAADKGGKVLAEGDLNLATAVRVEEKLKKLGAQVMMARSQTEKPSDAQAPLFRGLTLESLGKDELGKDKWTITKMSDEARRELESAAAQRLGARTKLPDWLTKEVAKHPSTPNGDVALRQAIANHPEFKKLVTDPTTVATADLNSRLKAIREFQPHIVLSIHHDDGGKRAPASKDDAGKPLSGAAAFVPGCFRPGERPPGSPQLAVAESLADNPTAFFASAGLASSIVHQLATQPRPAGERSIFDIKYLPEDDPVAKQALATVMPVSAKDIQDSWKILGCAAPDEKVMTGVNNGTGVNARALRMTWGPLTGHPNEHPVVAVVEVEPYTNQTRLSKLQAELQPGAPQPLIGKNADRLAAGVEAFCRRLAGSP